MKLGFLGCGSIASAVVAGIAKQGQDIRVSQRSASSMFKCRTTPSC